MKALLILLALAAGAIAEPLTLTDTKGRSLSCEIVMVTGNSVSIRKADGKSFDLGLSTLDAASRKRVADFETARLAKIEAERPKGLVVTSQAVKRISASSIGGDFRYFFYLRNHEATDWNGVVKIRLIAQNGIKSTIGEFKVATVANGGASGFFDSKIGPVSFHGEYGIVSFEVEAKDQAGNSVTIPGGTISSKFEDLAR